MQSLKLSNYTMTTFNSTQCVFPLSISQELDVDAFCNVFLLNNDIRFVSKQLIQSVVEYYNHAELFCYSDNEIYCTKRFVRFSYIFFKLYKT